MLVTRLRPPYLQELGFKHYCMGKHIIFDNGIPETGCVMSVLYHKILHNRAENIRLSTGPVDW